MNKSCLLPSLFAADASCIQDACKLIQDAKIERVHYDIMDNHFVPNISFGQQFCQQLMQSLPSVKADIHLMIELPGFYEVFLDLKPETLTIHLEAGEEIRSILRHIRKEGIQAGVAIKPSTPISALHALKDEFDLLLIMSVEPGFSFQQFIPETLDKIKEARYFFGSSLIIEADGGINAENMQILREAGLDWFVMGGGFFNNQNPSNLHSRFKALK